MDDTTNPAPEAPAPEVETEAQQIDTEAEPTEGADGEDALQAADGDDAEDIEFEGQAYRVPKPLKDGFLRQQDYTKKTQELASERTVVQTERQRIEADRQRFQQDTEAHGANLRDMARLMNMGEQIEAYRKLDWPAIEQQDAANGTNHAQRLFREQSQLERDAQGLAGQLHAKEQERQSTAQRESATRKEQAQATFARDIPGWSTGLKDQVRAFAISEGVTAGRFDDTTDPVIMKLAAKAYRWDQYEKKQRGAVKAATPQRPAAAPVPQVAARRTPSTGPSDKDSDQEWVRKERARMKAAEDARKRA